MERENPHIMPGSHRRDDDGMQALVGFPPTSDRTDALAFLVTVVGMWTLSLDTAIYLGVGISIVLYLRRANLIVRELILMDGRFMEAEPSDEGGQCTAIRVLHVEGSLFFAAAAELVDELEDVVRDSNMRVLVLRLKRTQDLDFTTA